MKHRPYLIIATLILFILCLGLGFLQAGQKLLWNDEIYTLVSSVNNLSFRQIFSFQISEGNICPLFYTIQKVICNISGYTVPELWLAGEKWGAISDMPSQIITRINPVVFMSLTIVLIFYFFSRFYSVGTGIYSLFLTLSSTTIWAYWAEARPYALWIFLTTAQSLLFLMIVNKHGPPRQALRGLIAVHILLACTITLSMVQVASISALLWLYGEKNWKNHLGLTLIPLVIALIYYIYAPKYPFWFNLTPEQLIRGAFSRDRFYILFMFVFYLSLFFVQKKIPKFKLFKNDFILGGVSYFWVTVLMLCSAFALIFVFKLLEKGQTGFPVSGRYFVYLTPVSIIATTLFSVQILRSLAGRIWLQIPMIGGIGYLVIHRCLKTIPDVKELFSGLLS